MDKQSYIRRELDKLFKEWSMRTALLGAVIFLLLIPLDFFSVPDHALRFLALRFGVAAALAGCAFLVHRSGRPAAVRLWVFLAVLLSAAVLETMIFAVGGHHSPYLLGMLLLATAVLGLIPADAGYAALLAGTIFAVYLLPILAWDVIGESRFFVITSILFLCCLVTGVIIRWYTMRRLVQEITLRHDLMESREILEAEILRRARSEADLRESREFLSSITAAAMDAIVLIDDEGAIRYWNPAAERIFGWTSAEAVGRPFACIVPPEDADALREDYRIWQRTGDRSVDRRLERRGLRRDGTVFALEVGMTPVARPGQQWACAVLDDITARRKNEERLRLFAAAVDAAGEGVYLLGLDGRIIYVNPAAARMSGRPVEELVGLSIARLHREPDIPGKVIMPELMRTGRWSGEVQGRGPGKEGRTSWLTASLVRGEDGKPVAMFGILTDLTAQRRLEQDHIKRQKLESIGVLAGGLAHDFNNLLTIILGNLDLARLFAGTNAEAAEALDHAAEAALRAGDLTRQLITFSKGGQPVKRVADIAQVLHDTVVFAASGSAVACRFDLPENLPPVEFDEGQMRQVFHNLVQNAREAMPSGGTLAVRARTVTLAAGEVPPLAAGRYVRISFADRGAGIPDEHLSRIFDPYFSTKEMGTAKGRGLGLAVTYSIVRSHGGAITVESVLGEGTTVSLNLPEAVADATVHGEKERGAAPEGPEPAAQVEHPPEALLAPPPGPLRGRVLIMDDEPLVLNMAGAACRQLGYEATLCRNGAEAVVRYQIALDSARPFSAVILDLTVPGGIGGIETLARLREIDPRVRAALSSGYQDDPRALAYADAGFAEFIAKPYTIKALGDLLGRLR